MLRTNGTPWIGFIMRSVQIDLNSGVTGEFGHALIQFTRNTSFDGETFLSELPGALARSERYTHPPWRMATIRPSLRDPDPEYTRPLWTTAAAFALCGLVFAGSAGLTRLWYIVRLACRANVKNQYAIIKSAGETRRLKVPVVDCEFY